MEKQTVYLVINVIDEDIHTDIFSSLEDAKIWVDLTIEQYQKPDVNLVSVEWYTKLNAFYEIYESHWDNYPYIRGEIEIRELVLQ